VNLLTERWFPIPEKAMRHPVQTELFGEHEENGRWVYNNNVQFKVVAAGRRSYKTERMKRRMIIKAALTPGNKNKSYFLGAPTRPQAKQIFWDDIKALTPKWCYAGKPKESELTLLLKGGNKIVVVGLEEYERIEGIRWDGCGITEYQKVDPMFFAKTLQPILTDTWGEAILEGRPLGKNHFYDDFNRCHTEPQRWASFHWTSEEILTPEQIMAAKNDLGLEDYKREYLADFETGGQRVYYSYSNLNHKKPGVDYQINYSYPFIVTCDFNATEKPMSWTIGQRQGMNTYWFKSLSYQYTNTASMCEILDKYFQGIDPDGRGLSFKLAHYPKILYFYGDYAGMKMTSNSSLSDWDIIEKYFRTNSKEKPIVDKRLKPTRSVRDRVAATNAQLCNANNDRRQFVDPQECKPLIRDWDRVSWKENGVDLDDKDDRDTHNSDSVDYYNDYEFPIQDGVVSYQK
jgi:hypothetical protein